MALRRAVRVVYAIALALGAQAVCAQTPPQTPDDALRAMAQIAGVIFAGQVIAVRRQVGANGSTGFVEIDFAVDDAVLGVSGSTYAMREWAGLWPAGDEPFQPGQHFLMLLNAPSKAGLSSPVDGMDGAIPIHGAGQAQVLAGAALSGTTIRAMAAGTSVASDSRVVDLRWVQTHVTQTLTYRPDSVARPTAMPTDIHANAVEPLPVNEVEEDPTVNSGSAELNISAPAPEGSSPAAQQAVPYASVLEMLRSWTEDNNAPR